MSNNIQSESDAGHCFRKAHGKIIRYVPEKAQWLIKDGDLWKIDESKGVEALIRKFLDQQNEPDVRWKGSLSTVRNVKGFTESDKSLHVSISEMDAQEFLLGTPGGLYNIKKRTFVKSTHGIYVTKQTSVDPDEESSCPQWNKFIKQIFKGDAEKIAYFKRFCGYLLTGSTKEQKILVIYGPGGNGKSVLVNTIAAIMGDYHNEALPETFIDGKSKTHETAMAYVAGARFVTSGETEQGGMLNEVTVKRATGADLVTARFLYKNPFTYRPCYKIWMTTNHLPRLKSVGHDMRRRIHLLELDYVPKKPDHDLERKLIEEHSAILSWMIDGAREWFRQGLNPPESITASTDQYFAEQDTLGTWLEQRTKESEGSVTPSAVLRESYNRFLRERGLPDIDSSVFGRLLSARGFESKNAKVERDGNRARCFEGIRLRMNT